MLIKRYRSREAPWFKKPMRVADIYVCFIHVTMQGGTGAAGAAAVSIVMWWHKKAAAALGACRSNQSFSSSEHQQQQHCRTEDLWGWNRSHTHTHTRAVFDSPAEPPLPLMSADPTASCSLTLWYEQLNEKAASARWRKQFKEKNATTQLLNQYFLLR